MFLNLSDIQHQQAPGCLVIHFTDVWSHLLTPGLLCRCLSLRALQWGSMQSSCHLQREDPSSGSSITLYLTIYPWWHWWHFFSKGPVVRLRTWACHFQLVTDTWKGAFNYCYFTMVPTNPTTVADKQAMGGNVRGCVGLGALQLCHFFY